MLKYDAPSLISPSSKPESNSDLIELFLPRTNSAIDFSKAEPRLRACGVDSHVHIFGRDLRFKRSVTLKSFARSSTEAVHGDKNLIRWLKDRSTGHAEISDFLVNTAIIS